MEAKIRCEKCGKWLRVPHEMTGKQQKCPACGNSIYIPTPEDELEELPLTPEDEADREQEARLQQERRALDRQIAGESPDEIAAAANAPPSPPAPAAGASARATAGTSIEKAVLDYLAALRDSDFDRAEKALPAIRRQPRVANEFLDRLAGDQLPPDGFDSVPPQVFQGFLRNLRSQL